MAEGSAIADKPQAGAGTAAARAYARERLEWRALHVAALVFFGAALLFGIVYGLRGDQFYLRLATEALIFGAVALSVDILLGFAGLLSLGQALYFGLGAYASALVLKEAGGGFWAVMAVSIVVGVVSGLIGGADRDPRTRRLLRADHVRARADHRQGHLQYPRVDSALA